VHLVNYNLISAFWNFYTRTYFCDVKHLFLWLMRAICHSIRCYSGFIASY